MALIGTLTDNFNDNSIDGAKWDVSVVSNGTISEVNSNIEMTTTAANGYCYFATLTTYDFTGSGASVKVVDVGTISSGYDFFLVEAYKDSTHRICFDVFQDGNIYLSYKNGGAWVSPYSATYVAATYRYVRIRESGGNTYADYSSDGITWTNAWNTANLFAMTVMYYQTYIQFSGATTATTVKFDDFNILPSASSLGSMTTRTGYWGDL